MATVKYVQTRDPDSGQLSEKHLLEVTADNVIFEEENMTLPQKMETKADKLIYGDEKISKGRVFNSTEGEGSIAFGNNIQALKQNSAAFGNNTIANSADGMVIGRYNLNDSKEQYAFIIGNGYLDKITGLPKRSNAFAVDWNGNVYSNKFLDLEGHEAITTLKNIQVGDKNFDLHGTKLHFVAGHNIILEPLEIESKETDGSTAHTIQVTITADKGAAGDGSGTGGGIGGAYLPLIGGTEYGPVIFNTVYDRTKFTTAEKEAFIKNSKDYREGMTEEEKEKLLKTMSYMPIVIGDPNGTHLNIDCNRSVRPSIDSYNETTKQGDSLFLNKSKGLIIMGPAPGSGIIWNPKKRSGGTGVNMSAIGTAAFGWGSGVSPTGQNSIALGSNSRAKGSSAIAMGDTTRSNGVASIAEGIKTNATATAAHAEGSYTSAKGAYSHTEGYGTNVLGIGSHSEGKGDSPAITQNLFTIESDKKEIESYWNSTQKFALVLGNYSHSEGINNLVLGNYNHVEGVENEAFDDNNHIEGSANLATGTYNHIEGIGHTGDGHYNHIIGAMHYSQGNYSFIGGMENEIIGNKNFIFGKNILAKAHKNIILGENVYIKTESQIQHRFIIGNDINIGQDTKYSVSNSNDYGTFILGSGFSLYSKKTSNTINFLFGKKNNIQIQDEYINNFLLASNININNISRYNIKNSYLFGSNDTYENLKSNSNFIFLNNASTSSSSEIYNSFIYGNNLTLSNTILKNVYLEMNDSEINNVLLKDAHIEGKQHLINDFYINENYEGCLHVEGYQNRIECQYGYGTHIEGYDNTADIGSHSEGKSNNNLSIYSHMEGINNYSLREIIYNEEILVASENLHVEGYKSIICGKHSHIEGKNEREDISLLITYLKTIPNWLDLIELNQRKTYRFHLSAGENSHTEGLNNLTLSNNSHTEGLYNINNMNESHIEGKYNYNYKNQGGHTEGFGNINIGNYSHIEGKGNILPSSYAIEDIDYDLWKKEYFNCVAGENNHVEGLENFGEGKGSHVEGIRNYMRGEGSHVEGIENFGEGKGSHVEGYQNAALGDYSHAEGTLSIARGKASVAAGIGVIAEYNNQYAIGKYNKVEEEAIVVIGNGTSDENRSNIVKISKDGIISANGFELMNGNPISGGSGSELPIGTVITNRNPDSSGIDYGVWECLGSQEVVLSKGNYVLYYWERTKGWIEPDEDEIYSIVGREVSSQEVFTIDGSEVSESEQFSINKI